MPIMNFKSDVRNHVVVVTSLVEKLDTHSAPDLKSVFTFENKKGHNKMLLDLSKTKFCDSSGLSAILVANRLCKDTNGAFAIACAQPVVLKMIEIAQLDRVFRIFQSVEEALADFE
jgi:anti-sigma B factor antagonist